ncbi:hypothetical protein [Allorhodopirellula heiligendammensis]|uniref:Uncharacterized protein n=1 Tax=Allorhodopirellula heiligendammensis TaxID=2714739 RepID=A0A5C6C8L8_9BACT|nr:hypothetical protein [Allorhodopirellula heiligendammensis]TWU19736.1 hypothetical protein Poly21_19110 [Allorhodopirellula heiligendammensis]
MAPVVETGSKPSGSWFGVAGISLIHLLAFGALYLTVVQLCWAAQHHYSAYGIADTEEFSRLRTVSNYVANYTPFIVILMFAETLFVARCIRKRKWWASAYSHTVVFLIGFAMFVSTAWMVHPMAWSAPAGAVAPVATDAASTAVHDSFALVP